MYVIRRGGDEAGRGERGAEMEVRREEDEGVEEVARTGRSSRRQR